MYIGSNKWAGIFPFLYHDRSTKIQALSDLATPEAIVTATLQILRSLSKALISKQDPVAALIAADEKSLPVQCPKELPKRISTNQVLVGYLKVSAYLRDDRKWGIQMRIWAFFSELTSKAYDRSLVSSSNTCQSTKKRRRCRFKKT